MFDLTTSLSNLIGLIPAVREGDLSLKVEFSSETFFDLTAVVVYSIPSRLAIGIFKKYINKNGKKYIFSFFFR